MPKIVEFLGPSGVGKSSLYHAVRERWTPELPWVTFHDLHYRKKSFPGDYYAILSRYLRKHFSNRRGNHTKAKVDDTWGFLKGNAHAFLPGGEPVEESGKNREFTSVVMDLVNEHCAEGFDGSDRRFVAIYMMMWSIAYVHSVKAVQHDKRPCLLIEGEGFMSRIMHLNSPSFNEKALETYVDAAPLPDILFLLKAPADDIVNRVMTRNRLSSLHRGMDEGTIRDYTLSTVQLMNRAAEIAESAGVNVFHVDTTLGQDYSTDHIVEVLTKQGNTTL